MNITENQRAWLLKLLNDPETAILVEQSWSLYDQKRDSGEWEEIDANPHVSSLMFALVGYPFSVRDGLQEMQTSLDDVIEKLSNGTVQSPWML
jgi:hypothetical protein